LCDISATLFKSCEFLKKLGNTCSNPVNSYTHYAHTPTHKTQAVLYNIYTPETYRAKYYGVSQLPKS